ncbi:MAG: rhomboid family intramembrane serine protease [Treponema sp.]|nr:rhomboid family intramembrane serine protease [Treponema sp.]
MRLKYNAPTVLSFTLLCALVLFLDHTIFPNLIDNWFMVPGRGFFNAGKVNHWVAILTHAAGHADWTHLISNFTLILLIGPMLEESYSSKDLLTMIIITAVITGILNVLIFRSYLLGASGVVFMMILLSSFTNFSRGEIPLTFILVLILYVGVEIFKIFDSDNISQFAHIIGGLCGSFFGFLRPNEKKQAINQSGIQRR